MSSGYGYLYPPPTETWAKQFIDFGADDAAVNWMRTSRWILGRRYAEAAGPFSPTGSSWAYPAGSPSIDFLIDDSERVIMVHVEADVAPVGGSVEVGVEAVGSTTIRVMRTSVAQAGKRVSTGEKGEAWPRGEFVPIFDVPAGVQTFRLVYRHFTSTSAAIANARLAIVVL